LADQKLHRQVFSTPRVSEFFEVKALQSQTGVDRRGFCVVVVKELMDNGLDAAESVGGVPEVTLTVIDHLIDGHAYYTITVEDNGPGIPPEVVRSILDFSTMTSDKRAYRSITRGQQGNALKTIIGIPVALGGNQPVIIEAQNVRHAISMNIDMASELKTTYIPTKIDKPTGTSITVSVPAAGQVVLDPDRWARAYALVNPHALVKARHGHPASSLAEPAEAREVDSYKPRTDKLDKPDPTSQTSPHWYTDETFAKLIKAHNRDTKLGEPNKPLGKFIREFKGLASSTKAADIAERIDPRILYLTDFIDHQDEIPKLLAAMKAEAREPKPKELGELDLDSIIEQFDDWYGVERSFKRHGGIVHNGVAWGIRIVVAETEMPGEVYYAVNYAPTYDDPLSRTDLQSPKEEVYATGAASFLRETDAYPMAYMNDNNRAVMIHITCPAPLFKDTGKIQLDVPDEVAEEIGKRLWLATNELYKDLKAREASGRKKEPKPEKPKSNEMTLKDACFAVMEEAVAKESGNDVYVFPARNLFYTVREKIAEYTTRKLTMANFNTILLQYRQERGEILGLYRDPRGTFHEPHGNEEITLGTLDVASYAVPDWKYIRVGYIEKEGMWPAIQSSGIPERFDMAWAMGKGRPTEAVRNLFDLFDKRHNFELYVVSDADSYGKGIDKNMREATKRMPDYNVKVIHLGLTVKQAIAMGMHPETYDDEGELDSTIAFNEVELEWFQGAYKEQRRVKGKLKTYRVGVRRVELNKFTMPEFIDWLTTRLTEEIEARGSQLKMRPPADVLKERAEQHNKEALKDWIITELDVDGMVEAVTEAHKEQIFDVDLAQAVEDGYGEDSSQWWKTIINNTISKQHDKHKEVLLTKITELIAEKASE
jgi:DNA topoisomerase VI subunit B